MKLLFVADPLESFKTYKDSTFAMMREATGANPKETKAILAKLTREGVAMAAGELWFSRKAVDGLKKLDPAPLATKDRAQFIDAANYGSDLEQLRGCMARFA